MINESELDKSLTNKALELIEKEHEKTKLSIIEKIYLMTVLILGVQGFCLLDMTHSLTSGALNI